MKNKIIYTSLIFAVIWAFVLLSGVYGQSNIEFTKENFPNQKKDFQKALRLIAKGDKCMDYQLKGKYAEALNYYLEANNFNQNNAMLNYKIGVCYTGSFYKNNSLFFLETAKKLDTSVSKEIDYYLGRAYQYNLHFEKAIESYRHFLSKVPEKDLVYIAPVVEKRIKECEFGKEFLANPNKLIVNNLGSTINSMWDDYSPVVSDNDSVMAFTTRRKMSDIQRINKYDYLYYEDVLFSYKDERNIWTPPVDPGKPINGERNDGCVDISKDGKILTIFKNKNGGNYLFEVIYENEKWSKPIKLSRKINKISSYENSATYSHDRNTIFFTSEDKEGFGGLDIYTSTKDGQGVWSKAVNLGNTINTPYNEDAIYLANDSLLYFSSEGHNSMGDFDVFFSKKVNNEWAEPVNMGYPMNSPGMDMFLFLASNGNAYYASDRQDGAGGMDIYSAKITMSTEEIQEKLNPISLKSQFMDEVSGETVYAFLSVKDAISNSLVYTGNTDSTGINDMLLSSTKEYQMTVSIKDYDKTKAKKIKTTSGTKYTDAFIPENRKNDKVPATVINGRVADDVYNIPVQPLIEVVDMKTNEIVANIIPDTSGRFSVILPSQLDYKFVYKTNNFGHKEVVSVTKDVNYTISIIDGVIIKLENIYFDFDRHNIRSDAIEVLDRHAALFNQHKDWKISINGHTDNMGALKYNYFLSKNRSLAAIDYLAKKGVKRSRMKLRGFGFDKPAISNETEKLRQLNRRVEFKVFK